MKLENSERTNLMKNSAISLKTSRVCFGLIWEEEKERHGEDAENTTVTGKLKKNREGNYKKIPHPKNSGEFTSVQCGGCTC